MTLEEFQQIPVGTLVRVRYRKLRYGVLTNKTHGPNNPYSYPRCYVRLMYNELQQPMKNTTQSYGCGWVDRLDQTAMHNQINTMVDDLEQKAPTLITAPT